MTQTLACSKCGNVLPEDAPGGVCPRCVLAMGWDPNSEGASEASNSGSSSSRLAETSPTPALGKGFTPPEPQVLGRHFPHLEILELLGHGGMGAVYKARQRALDRLVAVKVLPPEIGRDPSFAERFTREARALARLSHPNIVSIHDVGASGGYYYFVMEFVDGANLRELQQAGNLKPAEALAIVPQVCEALQYAHDEGIVHRDIKPENILVDKKGRVKIADFGLAKLLGAAPSLPQLTGTYQVMGTYHYMAPEQFERPHEVDHRADIYSLGVVLYELLTRELPIGRFSLPSHKAQIDVRLDDVVLRALEKDPPRRYQQASDVKTDVDAIVRGAVLAPPVARPPPAAPDVPVAVLPRALSVPMKIDNLWGGFAEGHGVLRLDGEELLLEYDVRENVFQALRLGSHRAALPLYDLSQVTFKPGWWAHTMTIQVSRFGAIAHLPGCDRGQLKVTIAQADRLLGEQVASAAGARLRGTSWSEALAHAESSIRPAAADSEPREKESGNAPGRALALFVLSGVMLASAIALFFFTLRASMIRDWFGFNLFLWPGIGLLLVGGVILSRGVLARRRWREYRPLQDSDHVSTWEPHTLFMGGLMIVAALVLLALSYKAFHNLENSFHAFFWPGIGLLIGGAGCVNSAFTKREAGVRQHSESIKVNQEEGRLLGARSSLSWPALGLLVAGILDSLSFPGLICGVGYLAYVYGPPPSMMMAYGVAFVMLRLSLAPLQVAAAVGIKRLENRRLAKVAAALALVPGSPAWLLGAPCGMWALLTLQTPHVVTAFDAMGASIRPPRLSWAASVVLGGFAGLVLVTWTYLAQPSGQVLRSRSGSWIEWNAGGPQLSTEFTSRVELRKSQTQAINDILASAYQDYRALENENLVVQRAAFTPWEQKDAAGRPRGSDGNVLVIIRPFALRRARLEARTWTQIDLALDEQQRGLARQCDLGSELFLAGREQVMFDALGQRDEKVSTPSGGPFPMHYNWDLRRQSWADGSSTSGRAAKLPKNLEPLWQQATMR